MKNLLFLLMMAVSTTMMAQDDDLYFVPEKPSAKVVNKTSLKECSANDNKGNDIIDYHSSSRSEDEYNRMYNFGGDSQNAGSYDEDNETDYAPEDDYTYSRRILRFRSPRAGLVISSPLYWDIVYTYGAYDYIYDSFYDPFYWGYGWRYGWSWGPWNSWYGPIWGWSSPHHWYHWGCGPLWGGGFHGHHHFTPYKHYKRGTFTNRHGSGERIRTGVNRNRTSVLASRNSSFSLGSAEPQGRNRTTARGGNSRTQQSEGTYTRYQRSRSNDGSNYNTPKSSRTQRSSDYNRPSSSRYNRSGESNSSSRTDVTNRQTSSPTNVSRGQSRPSSSRSSFSSGGSRGGSIGGGSISRGGGGSRGGRR